MVLPRHDGWTYYEVTAEKYRQLDMQISGIKRELNRSEGSRIDPEEVSLALRIFSLCPRYGGSPKVVVIRDSDTPATVEVTVSEKTAAAL